MNQRPTTENQRSGVTLATISKFYFGYHTTSKITPLKGLILGTLEGHLRAIIGTMEVEELFQAELQKKL